MKRRLFALARLSLYLAALVVVFSVLGARKVHAQSKDLAFAAAHPLESLPGGTTVTVNGQEMRITRARIDAPLGAVLDRVEEACRTHADGLGDDLADLARSFANPSDRGEPGIGVLRDERDARGVVVCFATGRRESLAGIAHRLGRFSETLDLADLGRLRYVAARVEDGATIVTATTSDAPLSLPAIFATEDGDAPGEDPSAAPRPRASRRILSARIGGAPYGVFVFEGASLDAYELLLLSRGFERVARGAYRRGGVDLVVTESNGALSVVESHHLAVGGLK